MDENDVLTLEAIFDETGQVRSGVLPEDTPDFVETLLRSVHAIHVRSDEQARAQAETIEGLEQRLVLAEERLRDRANAAAGKVDDPPPSVSLGAVCRAAYFREPLDGYEREVLVEEAESREFAEAFRDLRTMSTDQDVSGGIIVPPQYLPERLITMLDANAVVRQSGATVLSGLTGESVPIPRETAGITSYWTGEGDDGTEDEMTLGDVKLRPHELCTLVPVTDRLLRMSNPSVDGLISRRIAVSQALAEDLAFMRGDGGENEPLGLTNESGISTTTMNATPDKDYLKAMVKALASSNALRGRLGWVTSVDAWDWITGLEDATGRPLFPTNLAENVGERLLGFPLRHTTQLPSNLGATTDRTQIIFANWEDLLIGEWGGMEIARSEHVYFKARKTLIRACRLVDGVIARLSSFCSDVTVKFA